MIRYQNLYLSSSGRIINGSSSQQYNNANVTYYLILILILILILDLSI